MAKKLRFPLLVALATLSVLWVMTPKPAYATEPGTCPNGVGHYVTTNNIEGWGKPKIYGCTNAVQSQWCVIGTQHFEWDCVNYNGTLGVQNLIAYSPSFCGCGGIRVCCL